MTCRGGQRLWGKRRDDMHTLLSSLRMGIVSASSDDTHRDWDDDSQELARFARDIDVAPPRPSPQDERLLGGSGNDSKAAAGGDAV